MKIRKSKSILFSAICYIVLSLWALTTVYPIFWVIQNSFKAKDKILEYSFALPIGEFFTLSNYRTAFKTLDIFKAYRNSIFVSALVCILVVLLASLAAYGLVRYCNKKENLVYYFIVAGMMMPAFSTVIPVYAMERNWGIAGTDSWFLSMLSVILPQVAGNLSFAIVIFSGFIRELPIQLEEAAFMEGSSVYRIFFKVLVPMLKPAIATVVIFVFLWSYNDLFTQMFFLRRQETFSITRLLNEISSNEGTNYGLVTASVTLIVFPVIIVYIALQRHIISGMTAGAIKG